ncbi:MAG: HD domain-containing protein [Nanoarchaeota archaeon]|nr:HDIG domain-containing protein [Nanoarchaeota archaeon]MBU4451726.1 HDIG domain-containing protein [Nanoarchaeota archaeon]MCG2723695.1 HDIG domain-containing protein [archaeon]
MQNKIEVPTYSECMALLSKYGMPKNIVAHCATVSKIAVFIAERINARGGTVNVSLVCAAALLHDIDKIIEIKNKSGKHGSMAREILEKEGYPEVAKIAENHVLHKIIKEGASFSIEEKIVFYADKRVKHDKIVSLSERFEYLRERYPHHLENVNRAEPLTKNLEKELMDAAGIRADEITDASIGNV